MWAHDFRVFFTPLFEVLFTFPSRYWFAVGLSVVFSLTGWSPWIHAEFLVFRATQVPPSTTPADFAYGAFTRYGRTFQSVRLSVTLSSVGGPTTPAAPKRPGFGLLRVRSPLLAQSLLFSLPPGTEMFQFPGFAPRLARYPKKGWVAPFGHPRVNGYLPLTAAFRSLSRPSSPPRAKASFMCPCSFPLVS